MKSRSTRGRLLSSAAIGMCGAIALTAFSGSAAAQTVCSQAGNNVTCTSPGPTLTATGTVDATTVVTSGVGFIATDPDSATVTLNTAGNGPIFTNLNNQNAFFVTSTNDLTVTYDGDVSTSGAGSFGYWFMGGGSTTVSVGDSATQGATSFGFVASANLGAVQATIGNVSTVGADSVGVITQGETSNTTVVGNISTGGDGADGLEARAYNGFVDVQVGDVSTVGDDAIGVLTSALTTNTTVTGNIATLGNNSTGLIVEGTTINLTAGNVSTAGNDANAVEIQGTTVNGTIGNVSTTGFSSDGVVATIGLVDIDLTIGTVSTTGFAAVGVTTNATGTNTTVTGDISTLGFASAGIVADGNTVNVTVGNVTTAGVGAQAVNTDAVDSNVTIAGNISTLGDNSGGLYAGGESVDVTVGNVSTDGNGSYGIWSDAIGSNTTVAGNISTAGDFTLGVSAWGDSIDLTVGSVTTTGLGSLGIYANGGSGPLAVTVNGPIDVTGNGIQTQSVDGDQTITTNAALTAVANGIDATATGDGAITVIRNGAALLSTAGGNGIQVDTNSGAINITSGPIDSTFGDAVRTSSTTGNQVINLTGNISGGNDGVEASSTSGDITVALSGGADVIGIDNYGLNLSTQGDQLVTIGTGSQVNGTMAAIFSDLGETLTIDNSGTLGTAGGVAVETMVDVDTRVVINNLAGGTLNGQLNLAGITGPSTVDDEVNNAGTWTMEGAYSFGSGIDTVTNQSGGVINILSATGVFSLETITNAAGGEITVGPGTTFEGLLALNNAGTLDVLTGVTLDGGDTSVVNSGIINAGGAIDFGAGTDNVANNVGGTLALAAGTTLAGLESLTNAGTVNATTGLTFDGGATAVTNTGAFNAGGVIDFGAGADSLANNAGGTLAVAAGTTLAGLETLNNAGTMNANSGLTFDAGATTLTNTGTLNAQGILDFGDGADVFANTGAAAILNITGATTLVSLETMTNTGRINLNTFVLTGPAIAFTNGGYIDTSSTGAGLAGFTAFNNAGTLDLAAGVFTAPAGVLFTNSGTILADESASTITGQSSFANTGTIDLQDGVINDVLTINSDFAGSGGSTLLVDFDTTDSDLLVINGAASGTTTIDGSFLGGGIVVDGVLVVDATTATANAFVLGDVDGENPLIDFSLVQEGGDFFFVSAPSAAAFNPLVVPGFATDLWYQSANEVFAETVKPATTVGVSFWGNGYISRDKWDNDDNDEVVLDGVGFDVDYGRKTKRHGIQMGVDYGFPGARVGLTGGYGWAKSDGANDADLKAKGWNVGLYGQFGGITGFHGEFLAKHDRYDAEFDDGAFDGTDFDIRSTGFDGSLGFRFGMGTDGNVDIHGGLSHVRTKVDDIVVYGFTYDTARLTSTRGRAGVRATFGGTYAPYVAGTVYHEFKGDGDIDLFDGDDTFNLNTRGKGTWGRLEAGLSGNDGPGPILAAWGELGDRKGLGLRAGWRIGGARVIDAAPPPPPPPPVVEAPATQICSDGLVILATDSCPLPPPPPPMPEPERG